jgi:hypothetical protein
VNLPSVDKPIVDKPSVDKHGVDKQVARSVGEDEPRLVPWRLLGRGGEWVTAGLFALLAALFYAPLLLGVAAFPDGDFVHHFFPFSLYHHQQVAAGRLPVWNPFTYGGHPFLADVQAAVYYPVSNLLTLLTLPVADETARFYWLQVEAVVHTALAGWFAYLWTRDLTANRWGGVVGGVCFALSGYATGYAPLQLAVLRTAVWLPLLLWCLGRGWQQPRQWGWWLGGSGALGTAFLAGHSQTFMLLGYAAAGWVFCLAFARRPLQRSLRGQAVLGTLMVALVAVGSTAAQWLPSVEFVRLSVRANVDYAFVSGGLSLADFWQIVLPGVLTQYSPLYIGVIGGVLAIVALFSLRRSADVDAQRGPALLPWRVGTFYCVGLAVFALLASLGGNGPLYPLMYALAPGWSWFRGQERAAFLVVIALSGLAAYGMAGLPTLAPSLRRRAGFAGGAVVVASAYAFGLLWQLQRLTALDHAGYLLVAGVTLILGLAMALLVSLPGWSARRNAWIVTLAVLNLVWANAGINQLPGSAADRVRVAPEVMALTDAVKTQAPGLDDLPGRVYNEFRAYDDYGMRAGVEDVWGSSPLRVARTARLFEQFPLDRMWRLLGVEHVLTWRRELFGPSEVLGEFPQPTDTTFLHRLPQENVRAWLVPNVEVADDEAAWSLLADHAFDLDQTALVGPEFEGFSGVEASQLAVNSVTLARYSPNQLDVTVQIDGDAFLVVSETWLPGWEVVGAACDGGACPIQDGTGRAYFSPVRANLTLIGMWLPAGESVFSLRYSPASVRVGLWISGGTALVLVVVLVMLAWRRSRSVRDVAL